MGVALASSLGSAVGVAISPIPIAAVILMLFSERARANSVAFALGWVVGIALIVSVVQVVPALETRGEPETVAGWVKLTLGVLLLLAGLVGWRRRPGGADEVAAPGWMARIDQLRPGAAVGLGLLLSAGNPKNLLLAVAGGVAIATVDLDGGQTVATVVVFTVLAALSVLVPVVGYLIAGDRLDASLARSKDWLITHNSAVMAVLIIVFGVNLIGGGLTILAA
jgi:hypothetical protein